MLQVEHEKEKQSTQYAVHFLEGAGDLQWHANTLRYNTRNRVKIKKRHDGSTWQTMAFIFKHIVVGQVWMELEVSS